MTVRANKCRSKKRQVAKKTKIKPRYLCLEGSGQRFGGGNQIDELGTRGSTITH